MNPTIKKPIVTESVGTAGVLIRSVDPFDVGICSFQSYSGITERIIPWMWKYYLAFGNLTLLVGDPEQGKSLVALSLAACVTTGSNWPNGDINDIPPGQVLMLTSEDEASYVVKPRFMVAGGDANNLFRLVFRDAGRAFCIEKDLDELTKAKDLFPDLRLIIIDPVFEFTELDQNNNQEARQVLLKLKAWAEKNDAAILGIIHYNKKTDVLGADRVAGAKAITAVPRFVYCVEGHPGSNIRHLIKVKSNLAASTQPTIDFEVEGVDRKIGGQVTPVPRIKWMGNSATTQQQLHRLRTNGGPTAKALAKQWLSEVLKGGEPMAVKDIEQRAENDGHEWHNVLQAAKEMSGSQLCKEKPEGRNWTWAMPNSGTPER